MSKYNIGDKFEIQIVDMPTEGVYKLSNGGLFSADYLDAFKKVEKVDSPCTGCDGIVKGMNEAWEIARKISETDYRTLIEKFGTSHMGHIFQKYTAQEAKAKIEALEKSKEEIQVGDVVNIENEKITFMVSKSKDGIISGICTDGTVIHGMYSNEVKKIGKHYDLQKILCEMENNK